MLFERLAIDLMQDCDTAAAARILGLSWGEAWGIQRRAVRRGLERKTAEPHAFLGVDEKAITKGHRYFTLVCDIEKGQVEYIGEDRRQESLDNFYTTLNSGQIAAIKGVAMDMWDPFIRSTLKHVPAASDKIVFDRFHVMKYLGQAVDQVRKQEHKELLLAGVSVLTKTKYLWLYSRENLPAKHTSKFEELRATNLKTGRAWALKESLRELWTQPDRDTAEDYWKRWFWWASHSRLEPVRKAAKTVKRHIANILTYYHHPITNATCEGLNSKIQTIKQMACGFRNKDNFKTAIYFRCGGLSLYPTH